MGMEYEDTNSDNLLEEICVPREKKQRSKMKTRFRERKINFNWTSKQVVLLISEIQSRDALWNCSHPQYKNTKVRDELWREVTETMNIDLDEIRNKWNILRNTFRMMYIKLKNSGNGRDPSVKDSYNGVYRFLLFLEPTLQFKNEPMNSSNASDSRSSITIDMEEEGLLIKEEDISLSSPPLPFNDDVQKHSEFVKVFEESGVGGREHSRDSLYNTKTTDSPSIPKPKRVKVVQGSAVGGTEHSIDSLHITKTADSSSLPKSKRLKVVEETDVDDKEHSIDPPQCTKTTDSWNEISHFIAMNGRRWSTINRRLEGKFRSLLYKLVSDIESEAVLDCCN